MTDRSRSLSRPAVAARPRPVALGVALLLFSCLAAPLSAHDKQGFLYGTVTTEKDERYTGVLRWDDEESFWDDLFNSAKTEMPYLEEFGADRESAARRIRVLGREFKISWGDWGVGRQFVSRFGDIDRIEVTGSSEARLFMRDGTEIEVSGAANDVEADVSILDASLGDVTVPWRRIRTIQFAATPPGVRTAGYRLEGRVETTEGDFDGYIQWDSQECLSTDKLDGDEGDVRMSIEMGKIRSIERESRRRSKVVLKDGRELLLSGTNDVDEDIRDVLVEDPRFGRVAVEWDAFKKVTFEDEGDSGRGYDDFDLRGGLRGTVTTVGGKTHRGRLIYDLDETYAWEMLDGDDDDVSYSIPMGRIARIEPRGSDYAVVTLRNGEELRLEDTQDVTDASDGVLVITGEGGESVHVEWDDIERIEFE